jgi:hypothetical protein
MALAWNSQFTCLLLCVREDDRWLVPLSASVPDLGGRCSQHSPCPLPPSFHAVYSTLGHRSDEEQPKSA